HAAREVLEDGGVRLLLPRPQVVGWCWYLASVSAHQRKPTLQGTGAAPLDRGGFRLRRCYSPARAWRKRKCQTATPRSGKLQGPRSTPRAPPRPITANGGRMAVMMASPPPARAPK